MEGSLKSKIRFPASWLALVPILVLACFLRFYELGGRPLHGDETFHTVEVAAKPLTFILGTNYGSILDTLLIHFLLPLGKIETMARLPSALFGLLSVWVIFLIGKRLWSQKEGLIAALLAAVSTPIIFFSQEARGYTGLLFFSLISLYFFERARRENTAKVWILYSLSMALGLYAHLFLLVVLPVHAAALLATWISQRVGKRASGLSFISNRTLLHFFLSAVVILLLAFLLYLPTRKTGTLNAYAFVTSSVSSLFRGVWDLKFWPFVRETIKRLLAFEAWPPYFFIQMGLLVMGFAASLKTWRREWTLFLSYSVLPFILFALSNPPYFYASPQPNKFLFLLPILFLWAAHGLVCISAALEKILGAAARIRRRKIVAAAVWTLLISGTLFSSAVVLKDYERNYWSRLSLDRDRDTDAYLLKHAEWQEAIYYENYPNPYVFLMLFPVIYPDGGTKGIAVFESDYDYIFQAQLRQPKGMWLVLDNPLPAGEGLSSRGPALEGAAVETVGRQTLVHWPSSGRSLYENTLALFRFLLSRSPREERCREIHLELAKVHLLARNGPDARKELGIFRRLFFSPESGRAEPDVSLPVSRILETYLEGRAKTPAGLAEEDLLKRVADLLRENAEILLAEDRFDEALFLQAEAEEILPGSLWGDLSVAESERRQGRTKAAEPAYLQALLLGPFPKIETFILKRLREVYDIPFGYFLWQRGGAFHLRWFSQEKDSFSGKIQSTRILAGVGEFHLLENDRWKASKKTVAFQAVVENGRIEGLDIAAPAGAELSFALKIDGREKIQDRIVLLPERGHPANLPFSLPMHRSP